MWTKFGSHTYTWPTVKRRTHFVGNIYKACFRVKSFIICFKFDWCFSIELQMTTSNKWLNMWQAITCTNDEPMQHHIYAAWDFTGWHHGLLARYVKLPVAHAPEMPGTFSLPLWVSDPNMHHDTCVTHVPWCMTGSLPSGFLWNLWWGKHSWHSQRMRNPQFCVSGNRPVAS